MLELACGLPPAALGALAELERRTVQVDGGRLKLEWGVLRDRRDHEVEDILWWDGDRLVGFVGFYAFGAPTVELVGMVDPAWRRRGIATALLDAALSLCRDRAYEAVLLLVPRSSAPGRHIAIRRGARLDHSEHALVLAGAPRQGPTNAHITLRSATPADATAVSGLIAAAFGTPDSGAAARLSSPSEQTLIAELDGRPVGTVRLTRDGHAGGVYGFAVHPVWQGRGIGRDVLRRVCQQLRAEGAEQVSLEVAVDNDRALGLYTSIGFTPVTTEDYYLMPNN